MSIFNMKLFRFLGFKKKPKAPWAKYYTKEEMKLPIEDESFYHFFKDRAKKHLYHTAYSYYGKSATYHEFLYQIKYTANAFLNSGIRKGDVVTVLMPNTPEALTSVLALNKIGAIANVVHPLSSQNEIEFTLKDTGSVMLVVIDMDYDKIKDIIDKTDVYKVIIVKASNSMPTFMKIGYFLTMGRKYKLPKKDLKYTYWDDFFKQGKNYHNDNYINDFGKNDPAVMLHSGGTTGTPKAIVLSNGNFIAVAKQAMIALPDCKVGDKCLAIMPIFHGFGLAVCMYTPLCIGMEVDLLPTFKANKFDQLLNKYKPNLVIGVPTLFEAMIKLPENRQKKIHLDYLKYAIVGGDSLKETLNKELESYLESKGANKNVLIQGYGMTEALSGVVIEQKRIPKKYGSIGIPLPGAYVGIFNNEDKPLKYGEEGEICISGPNVMLGYYNNEKETNLVLHIHDDGNVWLHSGDIGVMDSDGYVHYKSRLKRLIISSGYNVYPSQIEEIIERHPKVLLASAIGVPHPYKMEVAKVFVVMKNGEKGNSKVIAELKELCQANLPKYAWPVEYEFRDSLPKTMIGKVDFRKLQEENNRNREINN